RAFAAKRRPGMALKLSMVMHPGNRDRIQNAWSGWEDIVEAIKVTTVMDLGFRPCTRRTACSEVWRGNLNVQTNGEVTPCCVDVHGTLSLGNLHETRLSDLVNNAAHRRLLEQFVAGVPPERCMHCTEFSGEGVPVKMPKRPVAGRKTGG
ncbi:MAG TPA: SPASM domain-containing protein, partial [Candidatus Hydrogenedentes bacterium]|nr:SPASM domain-containing protein [Candidatus Hydrogenedentota bacterium]